MSSSKREGILVELQGLTEITVYLPSYLCICYSLMNFSFTDDENLSCLEFGISFSTHRCKIDNIGIPICKAVKQNVIFYNSLMNRVIVNFTKNYIKIEMIANSVKLKY